jgi:hypothetical protein
MKDGLNVVEEHLDEGDPRVAIDLLRLAGGRLTETGNADERPTELHSPGRD